MVRLNLKTSTPLYLYYIPYPIKTYLSGLREDLPGNHQVT